MPIAIKVNLSNRARELKARHAYLTEQDLADLLEMPVATVRAALRRKPKDRPKSRVR